MNAKIMGQAEDLDSFYEAPELMFVLADKSMPTFIYDGSLAMGNLMIAAADLGVGQLLHPSSKGRIVGRER